MTKVGCYAIADFICPTPTTRDAFLGTGEAFVIFVDRIQAGAFADTNKMFIPPVRIDLRVTADGTPEYWAEQAMMRLRPIFDVKKPTALFVGRYQPFHDGHRALIVEGLKRVGQACIAVRTTEGIDDKTRSISNTLNLASNTDCVSLRVNSPSFLCRISPTSFTAATSATRSNASRSMSRPKISPQPTFVKNSQQGSQHRGEEANSAQWRGDFNHAGHAAMNRHQRRAQPSLARQRKLRVASLRSINSLPPRPSCSSSGSAIITGRRLAEAEYVTGAYWPTGPTLS